MRKSSTGPDIYGLVVCACIGIATSLLGWRSLAAVAGSYEMGDILYDEGPELFQAWLRREQKSGGPTPQSIAQRLLLMPIGSRRATVVAMTRPDFLSPVVDNEADRQSLLISLEDGIVEALGTAPSSGDLWFAASYVRSRTTGFDRIAEDYLAASYLTAPREGDLARLRHVYIANVSPLLRTPMEAERDRDRAIIAAIYPRFENAYRKWEQSRQKVRPDAARRSSQTVR